MLSLTIELPEKWDRAKKEFVYPKPVTISLEHSLVSLSKWESKWHKPFLSAEKKTSEETLDYIKCMTITQNVNPVVYMYLTSEHFSKIADYIDDPMTATWFSNRKPSFGSSEQVTSELIYYWMVAFDIPPEYQKWHLNRLLTLIRICEEKNKKQEKMSPKAAAQQQRSLNAARRAKHRTKG